MKNHNYYMKQCIALGKEAMLNGNPPVGSIIVNGDKIIGIGKEAGKSSKNITKHAEIEAVNDAIQNGKLQNLEGCKLYTTHEPCIMCSYVIRHYHIKTVVYGAKSKYVGGVTSEFKILEIENVPNWKHSPEIIEGILEDECLNLLTEYTNQQN